MATTEILLRQLKKRLKARRIKGSPVTEKWFMNVCLEMKLCPDYAKRTCANKGWLYRVSRNRFFPATNLVSKC